MPGGRNQAVDVVVMGAGIPSEDAGNEFFFGGLINQSLH